MGSYLTVPVDVENQESIEKEAKRLLHSYELLVKKIIQENKYSKVILYKQKNIHTQWNIIFPLLHKKDIFYKNFFKLHMDFLAIINENKNPLEEKLLS